MLWLLWVVLVGLIAGWATGKIMKGSGYGPLMDIALGIVGGGKVEAARVQVGRGRQKSDWRFEGRSLALTAFEDPLQHTAVLAVSGPQKFSVFILTKPVDVINLWQL